MSKVICMGECLVDNMPSNDGYIMQAGGAPLNVACAVSRLGGEGYFLGKLGGDSASDFLFDEIVKQHLDARYIVRDKSLSTAMAYISLDENGDRSFTFSRHNTADTLLDEEDIPDNLFESGDILHFGSLGLVSRSEFAHKKAINQAKSHGATVSFDVNIRENLWNSLDACVCKIKEYLPFADIVKVSDDELYQITASNCESEAINQLFSYAPDCKIVILTKGAQGATAYDKSMACEHCDAYKAKVVNTTGAGDCFIGAMLYLLSQNKAKLTINDMPFALDFASCASSIQISREGSMNAMPTLEEIEDVRGEE